MMTIENIVRWLGGLLTLTLALVMLVNPAWMNQVGSSRLVFLFAFGLTALALNSWCPSGRRG